MGNQVFLKVSTMKCVMHFGRKVKLSPRFTGPYKIMMRVEKMAYELK